MNGFKALEDELTDPELRKEFKKTLALANKGLIEGTEAKKQLARIVGLSLDEYIARVDGSEVKNSRLLKYIISLRKKYKIAILSNVSRGGMARRFTADEISTHFDVIVESAELGFAKPEIQAYQAVANELGLKLSECLMVDDREPYCLAARELGMQAVLYESFEQMKSDIEKILDRQSV